MSIHQETILLTLICGIFHCGTNESSKLSSDATLPFKVDGKASSDSLNHIQPRDGQTDVAPFFGCWGTISGSITGPFTCKASGNYYPDGSAITDQRNNSTVTIMSEASDLTNSRPTGVKEFGVNIEIAGELKVGSYPDASPTLSGTFGYVHYTDGKQFTVIKSLFLNLTAVKFEQEQHLQEIGKDRIYTVHGHVDVILTTDDETKEEVQVKADF